METTTINFNNNKTEVSTSNNKSEVLPFHQRRHTNISEQKIIDVLQKTTEANGWMFSDITAAAVLDEDKNCSVLNKILDICRENYDEYDTVKIVMIYVPGVNTNIKFLSEKLFDRSHYWTHGGTCYNNDFHKYGSLSFFYAIKAFADFAGMSSQAQIDTDEFINRAIIKRREFCFNTKIDTIEEAFIKCYDATITRLTDKNNFRSRQLY